MKGMTRARPAAVRVAFAMAALVALGGCTGLPAARMELPPALAARAPEPVEGIGYGRRGEFALGAERVRFERGRDRLEVFEAVSFDRAKTRYTLTRADGSVVEAACRGRQDTLQVGVVQADVVPFRFECRWTGAGAAARMTVAAPSQVPGTRSGRSGRFEAGALTLLVQSVHRVQGSALPLDQPIGYLLIHRGEPVGAIELNGGTPRLWRPSADDALAGPVTWAALALALLWDPADAAS